EQPVPASAMPRREEQSPAGGLIILLLLPPALFNSPLAPSVGVDRGFRSGELTSQLGATFIAAEGLLNPKEVLHHLCVVEGTQQLRRRVDRQDRWYMSQSGGG